MYIYMLLKTTQGVEQMTMLSLDEEREKEEKLLVIKLIIIVLNS